MKVLVVDADVIRAPALKMALAAAGAEVTVASSGSFALTMLEWNRHDIVVSRARIDDMDGHELCAILKSDPGTRHIRFVLAAGTDEVSAAQATAAGVDLVLPPTLPAGSFVPQVMRLVQDDAAPAAPPPAPAAPRPAAAAPRPAAAAPRPAAAAPRPAAAAAPPAAAAPRPAAAAPAAAAPAPAAARAPEPPAVPKLRPDPVADPVAEPPTRYVTAAAAAAAAPWSKASSTPAAPAAATPTPSMTTPPSLPSELMSMPSGTFQGSLEVMDLAELTQAIAMGGKNGRLILALPQGGGVIAFEGGQVVHAEYRGAVGEAAFAALLTAAHSDGAGRFCFLPTAAGEKPSAGRTIDKSVDRLLLSIVTAIDEKG